MQKANLYITAIPYIKVILGFVRRVVRASKKEHDNGFKCKGGLTDYTKAAVTMDLVS